jgi:hypothetical protein
MSGRRSFLTALFVLLLFQSLAQAKEAIETWPGPLSDDNFFNLVACGAEPDKPCAEPPTTWSKEKRKDLTVALVCKGVSKDACDRTTAALKAAINDINGAGADVHLRKTSSGADIMIYATKIADGATIQGINTSINGSVIEAAQVVVNYDDTTYRITDSTIVLGAAIEPDELLPITLEELTQALGPTTDIRNSYYDTRSVFSEDSNTVTKLGEQDKMVLRRLYPK